MDEHQEREIALGLCEGDTQAWYRLYDTHADRIWWLVARAMPRNVEDVADVVQEVFLAAARSAKGFDQQRGSLASWLNGIARRQVALYFRRETTRAKHVRHLATQQSPTDGASTEAAADNVTDPVAVVAGTELAEQVRSVLSDLPTEVEMLLASRYLDEASVEELAVSERTTAQAIRSRLARARQAFRRAAKRRFPGLWESFNDQTG